LGKGRTNVRIFGITDKIPTYNAHNLLHSDAATVQYSTVQYSTVQYNTKHYSTVQ